MKIRTIHVRLRFAAALCCITSSGFAQRAPVPYYEDTNNIPVSPEIRVDRTVGSEGAVADQFSIQPAVVGVVDLFGDEPLQRGTSPMSVH